ncbi:putative metallo-hydrolase YycJ [bioreactor metagenome]|uniref:Putative metallo-hydrolase YycJ n=1 Tax=bioreactor metagenome TaxID=1076179 RepID=A0A645BUT4_9ZZZZ
MEITPFPLSHDAVDPSGFRIIFNDGKSIGVATDTGRLSDEVFKGMSGADIVCIESNYDENMLKAGSYPYFLKRRILSDRGHLSNEDCACLAMKAVKNGAKKILLSHLSCENNLPDLAYMTTDQRLTEESVIVGGDVELAVSPRFACSRVFTL